VNALLASALWGTSDFGGGLMSRRVHPSAAVLISQAFALVLLLTVLPFRHVPAGGCQTPGSSYQTPGSSRQRTRCR
jgi:hypothetical protein